MGRCAPGVHLDFEVDLDALGADPLRVAHPDQALDEQVLDADVGAHQPASIGPPTERPPSTAQI